MRRPLAAAAAALALVAVSGCAYRGAQSLPLPGAIGGSHTYRVTVVFADATDLVAKETCRANDAVVGSVLSVELDDRLRARVVCSVKDSVTLPANAVATLRETSLLGERFVDLAPPTGTKPIGTLRPGAVIPENSTHADPNAEMVLGALSQLLNGGSLGSLDTISKELGTALRTSDVSSTTRQLATAVSHLDAHRRDILTTLAAMDRLTGKLARQRRVIGATLDTVPAGLAVLDRQRPRLVRTLVALSHLADQAVPLIRQSRASTVADLRHLSPVLGQLSKQSHQVTAAVEALSTFPFPHNSDQLIKGDYGGMFGTIALDITSLNKLLAQQGVPPATSTTTARPPTGGPLAPLLPSLGLGTLGTTLGPLLGVQPGTDPLNLGQLLGGGRS